MSKKIGIIVDGPCDFASLKTRFKAGFKVLKTDGPRGHTAEVGKIISKARKQVSMLRAYKCSNIIILLDFEWRYMDYPTFVDQAKKRIAAAYPGSHVDVAVPNSMIENWFLADIEWLSKKKVFIRSGLKQKNYEGTNGKEQLKKCFVRKYTYTETKHGPQLFAILRFATARTNSPSFDTFLTMIGKGR